MSSDGPSSLQTKFFKSPNGSGQSTAYRVFNKRSGRNSTPLIMIQGMSAVGIVDYHDLASALSEKRTVVVFDNRDIGESTWTIDEQSKAFTLEDLARDVVHLVQHLGYQEVDILGHSMGAQTLLTMQDLPFTVKHAVLGATSAKNPRSDLGKAMAGYLGAAKKAGKRPDPREMSEVMTRNCFDPAWIAANPELYELRIQQAVSTRRPATTIALQQRAIGKYNVQEKLKRVPPAVGVLVIHGKLDVAVYPEEAQYILQSLPHAEVLSKAPADFGHNWHDYFGTAYWVKQLDTFLDGTPKALKSKL